MLDSLPRSATVALTLTLILLPLPADRVAESQGKLTPTAHAALPDDPTDLWLVPTASERSSRPQNSSVVPAKAGIQLPFATLSG